MSEKPTYEELEQRIEELEKELIRRKQTEDDLHSMVEQYRIMTNTSMDGFVIVDVSGHLLDVNEAYSRMIGYSREELTKMSVSDIEAVATQLEIQEAHQKSMTATNRFESQHRRKDGRIIDVEVSMTFLPRSGNIMAFFRDITERKQAEEALREIEQKLRLTQRIGKIGSWSWEIAPDIVEWSEQVYDIFKAPRKEPSYEFAKSFVHPDDLVRWEKTLSHAVEKKEPYRIDYQAIRSDGEIIWVHNETETLINDQGEFVGYRGTVQDITHRKAAERTIEESEERFRTLFMSMSEGFYLSEIIYDDEGNPSDYRYLEANPKFAEIVGLRREQIIGKRYKELVPVDTTQWMDTYSEVARTGTPKKYHFYSPEYRMHFETFAYKSTANQVSVFVLDVTERKRMEEELLRIQKLESVGLLAGGIAHDFNNILTTILGNVSMAKTQVASEDEIFVMLSEAEMASLRAQALTKQLLTFAKGGAPVKEIASIKDLLKESSSFVLLGSKSTCEFSIAEDLWPAEFDPGQMNQVINNIMINANQAMPEGGIIQISADNLIIEDRHNLPVKPGRYIKISIMDQGVGIADKYLSRLFDPYFTTKQEGSGLGLTTSYSIVKKHEGHIIVESQLGVSTTFHIYLPASEKKIPEKKEMELIKGQGKILVMDDEASLRKTVGKMLGRLGYQSGTAEDGAEAIRMYKEAQKSDKPYDVVILDLTVPGKMGGEECVKELLDIDPEVKAIVSSGYSDDSVLANFQKYGFKGIIPKPYESRSLSKVLYEVLKDQKE